MDGNEKYFDRDSSEKAGKDVTKEDRKSGCGLFLAGLIAGLGGALLIMAVVYVGIGMQSLADGVGTGGRAALEKGSAVDRDLVEKLQKLEKIIDKYYYLDEVGNEELQDGIYRGLMEALDDPYSVYYSAEELSTFMEETEGIYSGIGAYMMQDTQTRLPMITGVMDGAPAEAAGLRPDDLIYAVDGEEVAGMTLEEAIAKIKGPEGTEVTLTVIREGENDYMEFTLTRAKVEAPTVNLTMMEDGMAYIEVTEFDAVTVDQFAEALAVAKGSGMKGMILDLRANPGGNLDAVVDMCKMILPQGLIVYTEDKAGNREEYTCDGDRELQVPLVVLVDGNSASAAEIMAGAIKDYGLGRLVGTTTFGKGIVQQIIPLKDGSAVKITTSAYFTPAGNNIHGKGIEPDIVCEFDGEAYYAEPDHPDNQLEKAKEVLREMMTQK